MVAMMCTTLINSVQRMLYTSVSDHYALTATLERKIILEPEQSIVKLGNP